MEQQVTVLSHPFIQHKLSLARDKNTPCSEFRRLLKEISMLMAYELTRDVPLLKKTIETPLVKMEAPVVDSRKIVLISILRAGNGLLDGMMELLPAACVGHIGLYRDPSTLGPVEYYCKLPADMNNRDVILLDPMLATGNSASAAIARVKSFKPERIKLACLVACPEGLAVLAEEHPDVPVFTAAIDERLNDHGYILPGLGDAGDRIYGTK
jgi:uracil phosphoribosyltransferase